MQHISQTAEVPGTGETNDSAEDDGVLQSGPGQRKKIAKAVKELNDIKAQRESLTARKRALLEDLVADAISRDSIERAAKDAELEDEKLEKLDFWYRETRRALNRPIQGDLFGVESPTTSH